MNKSHPWHGKNEKWSTFFIRRKNRIPRTFQRSGRCVDSRLPCWLNGFYWNFCGLPSPTRLRVDRKNEKWSTFFIRRKNRIPRTFQHSGRCVASRLPCWLNGFYWNSCGLLDPTRPRVDTRGYETTKNPTNEQNCTLPELYCRKPVSYARKQED